MKVVVLPAAEGELEDIYIYTTDRWGAAQADTYLDGFYEAFIAIAENRISWRSIEPEYDVEGFFARYESHVIFWRLLTKNEIGIFSVLHSKMNLPERLRVDAVRFPEPGED